jgi:hypothetical protein
MSDSSDDMEAYSGLIEDDEIPYLEERIERLEKIILALTEESFAGTGGKYKYLWPLLDQIKEELGLE